jgi:hypothetical protein
LKQQPPDVQQRVLMACQMLSQQAAANAAAMEAHEAEAVATKALGAGMRQSNSRAGNPLDQVPGASTTPDAAAHAAETEGQQVAAAAP